MSDFLSADEQSIIQSQKVATRGKKTAKQAHLMRKVRVSLYFGRSFDRNDTARYTWATLALSIDTPIEVISQALGHSYGQAVTLGYIMHDRRKVDEANKRVLGLLL